MLSAVFAGGGGERGGGNMTMQAEVVVNTTVVLVHIKSNILCSTEIDVTRWASIGVAIQHACNCY